jgi:23S rRNA (adenine2503-C2)-methyltransferase
VTFEYVMLGGVNDSDEDADRLGRLLRDIPSKVNLIPYNESPGLDLRAPGVERVESFRDRLVAAGITAVVRKSRGRDIAAACGQLAAGSPPVPCGR